MPIYNKDNELCHMQDTGTELKINSLKGQYENEQQLYALMSFLITLETMGLM